MLEKNPELFNEFRRIHDQYTLAPEQYQEEFNTVGRKVQDVIRRFENILCGKSETSGYSQYSSNLAQKFQDEIRTHFPKIDFIGIKVASTQTPFNIKRIKL